MSTMTTAATFALALTEPEAHDRDTEHVIRIDGRRIGGIYQGTEGWVSYGPAGFVFAQRTVDEAAEVQARAYAVDPSGYDRMCEDAERERQQELAERAAREEARRIEREAEARRRRLGDDEPGPTILTIPAYHALYAPVAEVNAVSDWLTTAGVDYASAVHEMRVERRAERLALVHECLLFNGKAAETRVATVTEPFPAITVPDRPDLHSLFETHWPSRYPLVDYGQTMACRACTGARGRVTVPADLVPWPCPPVAEALSGCAVG